MEKAESIFECAHPLPEKPDLIQPNFELVVKNFFMTVFSF